MARLLPYLCSACLALSACSPAEDDKVFTDATGELDTGSGESSDDDPSSSSSSSEGTDTGTGETGEPAPDQVLRFLSSTVDESVLIALDLDDPHDVPPPDVVEMGGGIGGLFGTTPFGTQAVVHDGNVDQISVSEQGNWVFEPLAEIEAAWIDSIWFGDGGLNALISVGPEPYGPPNKLYWTLYDENGKNTANFDITPPLDDNGVCFIMGRSPNGDAAAALVDAEQDGIWQIYVLPLEPELSPAIFVENQDLTGIPPINVPVFLWAHVDNLRVSYRKELLPNMFRPVAVDLANPEANPRNIGPTLPHVFSIVWNDSNDAMIAATEGADEYRILNYVKIDGAADYQLPVTITEPDALGLSQLLLANGPATPGHGFDAKGRIWYAYTNNGAPSASIGLQLVTIEDGVVVEREQFTDGSPLTIINDIAFDKANQILAYRVESATSSWVNYVDLSSDDPRTVRVDQNFTFSSDDLDHAPRFGLSADGSTIAVAGIQANLPVAHVSTVGDLSGSTIEIALPDVERNNGALLDLKPRVSPQGDQLLMWYRAQTDKAGLIHAPMDGTPAQIVLTLQHPLVDGVYMSPN